MKNPFYILSFILFSGLSHVYAQSNTVYGSQAGKGGAANTHIGYYAGRISTGNFNVFLGFQSGYYNTTGKDNIFLGSYSGAYNTTGKDNTFLGTNSGKTNTTGSANTFIGYSSGSGNKGSANTFLGYRSGMNNTTGNSNNFLGYESGLRNTTGYFNTFIGNLSGYQNTTGSNNTFLGYLSGLNNTTGSNNTFLGPVSGFNNKSGGNNVFIGYKAGYSETGSNRLYIDNNDDNKPLLYGNFSSNVLSIGKKYTGTAYKLDIPGKVRATAYDVVSDERLKKDVHALQDALTKVQKVDGVSYALKEEALVPKDESSDANTRTTQAAEPILYGFLAQNIQEVFPELVTEDEGMLAVNYQGMIPVLVEAIKALTEQTKQKDSVIHALQQDLFAMKQALQQHGILSATDSKTSSDIKAQLEQNYPNPFDQRTTIRYQVSTEARQVSLHITDLQGTRVQQFDNLSAGQGQVEIEAGSLRAGTYMYTLVVDGQPQVAHKMILTK